LDVIKRLELTGIVPVIVLNDPELAVPLGRALLAGGVDCAEVTFRTQSAAEVIKRLTDNLPELLVGAGTVLNAAQVDSAVNAGAKFIVSPGLNPNTVTYCQSLNVTIIPGCVTPSDIERAIDLGLNKVKFFPAEASGGLSYIKAVSAPYAGVKFMPTGGISLNNLGDYIGCKAIFACGGSYMVSSKLIENREWTEISELCLKSVEIIKTVRSQTK